MNKLSLILAVALATSFTLTTSCGEKTQTPEQLKMVAIKEGKEAERELRKRQQKGIKISNKELDSIAGIINKGHEAMGDGIIAIPNATDENFQPPKGTLRKLVDSIEAAKASRNAGK